MTRPLGKPTRRVAAAAAAAVAILAGFGTAAADDAPAETVRPVFAEALPNAPGQVLTGLLVTYPPGGRSPAHRHAGSVVAYVLSGAVRSRNSATGPERIYRAGDTFFEPPRSEHVVSRNASATEPASLLAIFVAPARATLTEGR